MISRGSHLQHVRNVPDSANAFVHTLGNLTTEDGFGCFPLARIVRATHNPGHGEHIIHAPRE